MPTTYRRTNTDSDLGGGQDFNKAILDPASDTTGSQNISVGANSTRNSFGYTDTGIPGADGVTGDYSVEMDVVTAQNDIQISAAVARVNSSGTQQAISSFATEQQATAGVHTFNFSSTDLGTWASGDRLRVTYRYRNAHQHSSRDIEVNHGGTGNEVTAPWTTAVVQELAADPIDVSANLSAELSETVKLAASPLQSVASVASAALDQPLNWDTTEFREVGGHRHIVRTSNGLYAFALHDPTGLHFDLSAWKLVGSDWVEQDSSNRPTNTDTVYDDIGVSHDSTGVVHVTYLGGAGSAEVQKASFDTGTDTWGSTSPVLINWGISGETETVDLAVDDADEWHTIQGRFDDGTGDGETRYTNQNKSGIGDTVLLQSERSTNPRITTLTTGVPVVLFQGAALNLRVELGNAVDATSFSTAEPTGAADTPGSIAVDTNDDVWVAYVSSGTVHIVQHVNTDAWATWQTPVSIATGSSPSIAIHDGEVQVIYIDGSDRVVRRTYDGSVSSAKIVDDAATFTEARVRWQPHNLVSYDSAGLDVFYYTTTLPRLRHANLSVALTELTGSVSAVASNSASLTSIGTHDLVASSSAIASISASLLEAEQLSSSISAVTSLAGSLNQVHQLTASTSSVASVDGSDLTVTATATPELQLSGFRIDLEYSAQAVTAIELSGSISAVASTSADLLEAERLASSISSVASNTATLSQVYQLAASTSAVASLAANLTETERLATSISSVASIAASITQAHEFTASLDAVASNTAQLTSAAPALTELEASLSAVASVAGTPTQSHALTAQVTAVASTTADLLEGELLRSQVRAVASLAASITQTHSLAASVRVVSSTSAAFTVRVPLTVSISSVASLSANLSETEQLSSSIASVASLDASLTQAHEFTLAATSVASVAAVLTNRPPALTELEASLSVAASLDASLTQAHAPTAQLSSAASIDAQLSQAHTPTAQVQAVVSLAASLTQVHALAASTSAAVSLDTAALSIQRNLTATTSAVASSSARLTQAHALASTITAVASSSAKLDIEGQIELDVAVTAVASATASLTQAHRLAAASSSVASIAAALHLTTQLVSTLSAVVSSSADLTVTATVDLTATVSAVSSTSATLTISGRNEFTADLSSTATVTGTPTQVHQPTSTVSAVSSTSATLSLGFQLAASLSAVASATSSVHLTYHLAAALSTVASTTATPTQVHQALILAQAVVSTSANITQISPILRGYIASMSTALVGDVALSSSVVSSAALSDSLVGAVSHEDDG